MSLKIAFQMDHVATVSIAGDTSFALALEAQRRGHELYHYTPDRLSMRDGEVTAWAETMRVEDVEGAEIGLDPAVVDEAIAADRIIQLFKRKTDARSHRDELGRIQWRSASYGDQSVSIPSAVRCCPVLHICFGRVGIHVEVGLGRNA